MARRVFREPHGAQLDGVTAPGCEIYVNPQSGKPHRDFLSG
jgi:hypothetical protein